MFDQRSNEQQLSLGKESVKYLPSYLIKNCSLLGKIQYIGILIGYIQLKNMDIFQEEILLLDYVGD